MGYKILIADDDPDIVKALKDRLEFEGFETTVASEGVRAIELAHKEKPDLILLDLKMPTGTGQSVLQALRARPDTERIPVIVLTAMKEEGLKERLLAKGASAFFEKPYEEDDLLAMMDALLKP